MTRAAYRILELPSGEYALEKLAGDLWVRLGAPFKSLEGAETGMERAIVSEQWYYDKDGELIK